MTGLFSWTSLAIAAVVLVLVLFLVAFRVFGRNRIIFRFRGAVTVSPWAQQPCPHLGLLDEPFIHRDEPNGEHRCYLWMQRDRIDLTHQKGFCLGSAHSLCPWMSIAPPVDVLQGEGPVSRRLRTAMPTAGAHAWDTFAGVGSGFLDRFFWKMRRAAYLAKQWADVSMPVVVAVTIIVSRRVSLLSRIVARAIAHQVETRGPVLYGRISLAAALMLRRSIALAGEAISKRSAPAPSATQTIRRKAEALVIPAPPVAVEELAPTAAATSVVRPMPSLQPIPGRVAMSHADSLIEQGKTAGMSGNRRLAYSLFTLALDLDPKLDEAWLWKGAMSDSPQEKLTCIRQALTINPDNPKALQALRQMGEQPWEISQAPAPDPVIPAVAPRFTSAPIAPTAMPVGEEALMASALAAMERGDEDEAFQLFVKTTEKYPRSEKAWFWRAKSSATLDEVIYCLQQALAINPDNEKVRMNMLWAIQRKQREEEVQETERKAVVERKKATARAKPRRGLIAKTFRWLAALICLALAAYWVSAAVMPVVDLPALQGMSAGLPETAEIDLTPARPLYDTAARWLPGLTWVSLPWYDKLEITSGYNLVEMVPYTVGFFYFFIAIGVAKRQKWSRFWGLAITLLSLALGTAYSTNPLAATLITTLGLATIFTLLISRSEFKRDTRPQAGPWPK